jgi:16S rRNA (uracil1498-N3)-methyltransferase
MRHVPHLFLPPPWGDGVVALGDAHRRHLEKVLKRPDGPVTYTDGQGTTGSGSYGAGRVHRGAETHAVPRSPRVTLLVAPPRAIDRQRFVVEKCAELGVAELVWVASRHTEGRPPSSAKAHAWVVGALEQSRGDYLMTVRDGGALADLELEGQVVVCDPSGRAGLAGAGPVSIVVGPEGGLADDEALPDWDRVTLGPTILRTETAAVVAAAMAMAGGWEGVGD